MSPTLLSSSKRPETDESTATMYRLRLQFILEAYLDLLAELTVASLAALRGLPGADPTRASLVAFGDPVFSDDQTALAAASSRGFDSSSPAAVRGIPVQRRAAPATRGLDSAQLAELPRLPDTAEEVEAIAAALGADSSSVFVGVDANEERVKSMDLSAVRVVVFATHGLVPGDLDGLTQPALALSSPEVSRTVGDGVLTMTEVLGLRLDADWVVLSACNTGTGAGAGAEAVSGLGRAFFYAGSRALLVTNWPVHSASAKDLTTDLFARQARDSALDRADALRDAMISMIDDGGPVDSSDRSLYSYAHPLFWAPFSVVGDSDVGAPTR